MRAMALLLIACGGDASGVTEPLRPDTTETFRSYVTMPEGCITVRAERGGYVIGDYGYVTDWDVQGPENEVQLQNFTITGDGKYVESST